MPKQKHSPILRGRFLGVLTSYLSPRREVRTASCLNPWLSASSTRLPLALCTRAACSGERISRGGGDGSGERVGLLRIQRLAREAYSKTTSHGLRPAGGYPEAVWAPGHATGRPKLRPASANQPLGPRSPAIQASVSTWRETRHVEGELPLLQLAHHRRRLAAPAAHCHRRRRRAESRVGLEQGAPGSNESHGRTQGVSFSSAGSRSRLAAWRTPGRSAPRREHATGSRSCKPAASS